jgi:hypothetical protein
MALAVSLAIIALAAGFHTYWAVGGRIGLAVSRPQDPNGVPIMARRLSWWRPVAGAVALSLLVLAVLLLARAQVLSLTLPSELIRPALSVGGIAFVARSLVPNRYVGFFKSLRTTRWAAYDTRLYSPLFLLLGLLILVQAL